MLSSLNCPSLAVGKGKQRPKDTAPGSQMTHVWLSVSFRAEILGLLLCLPRQKAAGSSAAAGTDEACSAALVHPSQLGVQDSSFRVRKGAEMNAYSDSHTVDALLAKLTTKDAQTRKKCGSVTDLEGVWWCCCVRALTGCGDTCIADFRDLRLL